MKNLMKLKENKGFTLVELMIVISIIAILAVVLVPKVGSMKDSVRDQGVISNVNSVRAYLELKVNSRDASTTAEGARLRDLLRTEFVGGNAIINPMTNGESINYNASYTDPEYSVIVYPRNYTIDEFAVNTSAQSTYYTNESSAAYKGKVFVFVLEDGYAVFGELSDYTSTDYQIVR